MANAIYDKGRQAFAEAKINWIGNTIKAQLLDLGQYTLSQSHEFLSSIPNPARVSAPQILGSKTATNGNCLAGDLTFPSVPGGYNIVAYVIYKDTGVESTSNLIAYIDTFITDPGVPYPIPTNGASLNLNFDGIRIFRI